MESKPCWIHKARIFHNVCLLLDRCYDFWNIFAQKMAFLSQNKANLCKRLIITLVFEINATFFAENCQKSQKIVIITLPLGHTACSYQSKRAFYRLLSLGVRHRCRRICRIRNLICSVCVCLHRRRFRARCTISSGDVGGSVARCFFFKPKSHFGYIFGRALVRKMLIYFTAVWTILRAFGIFYEHLVHFVFIWYHVPRKIWQPWVRVTRFCNSIHFEKDRIRLTCTYNFFQWLCS
jgi:hypothetical protein